MGISALAADILQERKLIKKMIWGTHIAVEIADIFGSPGLCGQIAPEILFYCFLVSKKGPPALTHAHYSRKSLL